MMKKISMMILMGLALGACSDSSQPNREYLPGTAMLEGPDQKAQEGEGEGSSVRQPPQGAIPRNRYVNPDLKLTDAETLKSPKATLSAEELLKYEAVGMEKFKVYCAVCHGPKGDGQGSLVKVAAKSMVVLPPNLLEGKYKEYSDGRIYYAITYGFGLMGDYSNQIIHEEDRWAVVDYLRQLQKINGSNASGSGE